MKRILAVIFLLTGAAHAQGNNFQTDGTSAVANFHACMSAVKHGAPVTDNPNAAKIYWTKNHAWLTACMHAGVIGAGTLPP